MDKPLIQYAVEEAYAAGIRQMIFVTGRHKRAIKDHFDTAYKLEAELEAANKHEMMSLVRSIKPNDMSCVYVRQAKALGLGHAVLCAEPLVGNEAFAVLLADDLMIGKTHILQQMVQQYEHSPHTILVVQDVPLQDTKRYGILDVGGVQADLARVIGTVEKPSPEAAPSTLAVAGRYILTPGIFESIRLQTKGAGGEIQLPDGIAGLLHSEGVLAYRYEGQRYDCGSREGYIQATIEMALRDESLAKVVRQAMTSLA